MMQISGYIPPHVHMHLCRPSHRALKIQQNWNIWVLIETFKHALQTNFSYINKMTSFTNIMTNVGNYKR